MSPGWVTAACLVLGLSVFTRGFLSTRHELPDTSSPFDFQDTLTAVTQSYDKAVILVVDALRLDFYARHAELDNPHAAEASNDLPCLRRLVDEAGPAAIAVRFVADTPTITISRLKAWLTGSLPTFLDIGQSFSAVTLSEDNLLSQLAAQGKRTVFVGDDTWVQLAPHGVFAAAHPFPSFNVLDLHTVDDGVWQHLRRYIQDEPDGWDVLVGHYLGVDHAGHAHGVGSAAMAAKLKQLDAQAAWVAEQLVADAGPGGRHERTLLLVVSDHGQTLGGDHGGASPEEVDTLLLAFNLAAWWRHRNDSNPSCTVHTPVTPTPNKRDDAGGCAAADSFVPPTPPDKLATVRQLDFTATLALLLGLPVPYSNMGGVDPSLWATLSHSQSAGTNQHCAALLLTAAQVHRYIRGYNAVAGLPSQRMADCERLYGRVMDSAATCSAAGGEGDPLGAAAIQAASSFLAAVADLVRLQFTGCNLPAMVLGCLLVAAVVARLGFNISNALLAEWKAARKAGAERSARRGALLSSALPLCACLFHAGSLFGLDWMMTEGRVLCTTAALCLLGLGAHAVVAAPGVRHHAAACAVAAAGLISVACMAAWGLMDRGSADPHHKAAQIATLDDLLGAARDSGITAVVPFMFMPWLAWGLNSLIDRLAVTVRTRRHGPCWVSCALLAAVGAQCACCALWWLRPVLEPAGRHVRLAGAELCLVTVVPCALPAALSPSTPLTARGAPLCRAVCLTLLLVAALPVMSARGLMNLTPSLPARLLLPRAVYALAAGGAVVVAGAALLGRGERVRPGFWLPALLWSPVALLLGRRGPWVMLAAAVATLASVCLARMATDWDPGGRAAASLGAGMTLHALSSALFFASGHFCEFTGLHYASPFIGFDEMQWWISPVLMTANTFGAMLAAGLALALVQTLTAKPPPTRAANASATATTTPSSIAKQGSQRLTLLGFMLGRCSVTCCVLMCATVLHSHILVWAIIAPRVVFELCFQLVATVASMPAALL